MKSAFTALTAALAQLTMALPRSNDLVGPDQLFKRQTAPACCGGECATEAVPGTEYDLMWHTQAGDVANCQDVPDGNTCSAIVSTSYSVSWSADIGVNTPFASIGFGVTQTWTSGESISCPGVAFQAVCVWSAIPFKAYQVIKSPPLQEADTCTDLPGGQPDGPYEVKAPSNSGAGGEYCVYGDACRTKGEGYWENWGLGTDGGGQAAWPGFNEGP